MKQLLLFFAAFAFFSCSTDDFVDSTTYLTLNVAMDGEGRTRSMPTSSRETQWNNGDAIGVTLLTEENATSVALDNTYNNTSINNKYTFKVTDTEGDVQLKWNGSVTLSNVSGYVYAYYPYQEGQTSENIQINNQEDWMYGKGLTAANNTSKNVSIKMNHALSSLKVSFTDNGYSGTGSITAMTVSSKGWVNSATMNYLKGTISAQAPTTANSVSLSSALTLSASSDVEESWLVIPSGLEGDVVINATIDGVSYSSTFTGIKFLSGNRYSLNLKLSNAGLVMGDVSINPWVDDVLESKPLVPNI